MLDESFIQAIQDACPEATKAEVIRLPAEAPHIYAIHNRRTGDLHIREAAPTPRRDAALTLDGIAETVKHHIANKLSSDTPVVAVGESAVVFLPCQTGHRRVTLTLKRSEQFRAIESNQLQSIEQKKLDWTLRTVFKDQISPEGFAYAIKQLKFSDDSKGTSTVSHGRESMGVSIEREVSGANEIAEEIILTIPVFEGVFWKGDQFFARIRCAVHIDAQERKFTIRPLSGEVSKALADARAWICRSLSEEITPATEGAVAVIADLELQP